MITNEDTLTAAQLAELVEDACTALWMAAPYGEDARRAELRHMILRAYFMGVKQGQKSLAVTVASPPAPPTPGAIVDLARALYTYDAKTQVVYSVPTTERIHPLSDSIVAVVRAARDVVKALSRELE